MFVGARRFIGRTAALIIFNAGMGLPPVFVGLIVAMTLSRRGPLGDLSLLYSKTAMVIAQVIIATPVIMAVTAAAVAAVPRELQLQAKLAGAQPWRVGMLTLSEARMGLIAAVAAGFGAVISEVGRVADGRRQPRWRHARHDHRHRAVHAHGSLRPCACPRARVLLAIIVFVNIVLTGLQTSAEKWERQ